MKTRVLLRSVPILIVVCSARLCPLFAGEPGALPQTISLDGTWQIAFDPANIGRDGQWHKATQFDALDHRRDIAVPSCWEENKKDYEGVAWYQRRFKVPADWADKVVRLHFDAVNFQAEVWINGRAVGFHQGGFTPFDFRVDKTLDPSQVNTLTVRVAGPILLTNQRIEGIGKMETPQWRGAITGGIWQSVRLVATGETYIDDVFIKPNIAENTAVFDVSLQQSSSQLQTTDATIAICPAGGAGDVISVEEHASLQLEPGGAQWRAKLAIPDARYWSPDDPHLYRATITLKRNSAVLDRFTTRFGMREFTIRDSKFYLNDKPIFLKATFFEGLYPVKLAYPDSRAMVQREIRLAKEAGFNMIRPWRKPPPPMWLDLADEMGVLTVGSLAIECMDFPIESPRLPGWVANEVRQSILRDRNRACVVQWELFNELKRPVLKQLLHPSAMLARQIDPTRLILDESGGWAQGARMYLPYQSVPIRFNDIHHYPGPQINDVIYEKLRLTAVKTPQEMQAMGLPGRMPGHNLINGQMSYFSELGYGSLPDLVDNNRRFAEIGNPIVPPTIYHRRLADQHMQAIKATGFDDLYPDLKQFCIDQQLIHGTANKRMIEAVRCNPLVAGYCIHALVAGDWIIGAGLLDMFRNPKTYAYEGTKAANQSRIVCIRVRPRNAYASRGTTLSVMGVNELAAVQGCLTVNVSGADDSEPYSNSISVKLASGITDLFKEELYTRKLRGTYTVKATLTAADGTVITENSYPFDVFTDAQLTAPKGRIAVLDTNNSLRGFLKQTGIDFVEFNPDQAHSMPVFVSRTAAANPRQVKRFEDLTAFIKSGGTAVYLGGGGGWARYNETVPTSPLLPVEARLQLARGNWICVPKIVRDHPIFKDLPTDCMMGSLYENVFADVTLRELPGRPIVASIGYDYFPDMDRLKRHYYGPGDVWHGADLAVVPCGKGRLSVSQLRLVDNLGHDPVADKILMNMIEFSLKDQHEH